MVSLKQRVKRLETRAAVGVPKVFRWLRGVSLADALADRGLTFEDGPFLAVERTIWEPGDDGPMLIADPVHDRDRHLIA